MIMLELPGCLEVLMALDVSLGDGKRSVEAVSRRPSCIEPAVPVVRWCQLQCGLCVAQACRVHDRSFLPPEWLTV